MREKGMVWIVMLLLIFGLTTPVAGMTKPSPKEEVVYVQLGEGGETPQIYIVNIFQNQKEILDYGHYDKVRNMTTEDSIQIKDDKITAKTNANTLCYQGNIKGGQLPWNISIEYRLNDRYIQEKQLAGESGALEIYIHIGQNKKAKRSFFKTHTLQVSVALNTNLCHNIGAVGATKANAGGDKQLTWTILPGKEKDIHIRADVTDFEMKSISINAIKMNMDLDVDSGQITGQFAKLANAIEGLDQGAKALSGNMKKFSKGTAELKKGNQALEHGLNQLSKKLKKVGELAKASSQMKSGIQTMTTNLEAFHQKVSYAAYKAAMSQQGLNIDQLQAGNNQAKQQLTAMAGELNALGTSEAQAQAQQLRQVVEILSANQGAISGMESYLGGLNQASSQLTGGAKELNKNYKTFDQGIQTMTENLKKLDLSQSKSLTKGIEQLAGGSQKLAQGSSQLADGTGQLKSGTLGIVGKVEAAIGQITGNDGAVEEVKSFASAKNTDVKAVQFVIKSKAIQIEKDIAPDESEGKQRTFLQKFLDLFRG